MSDAWIHYSRNKYLNNKNKSKKKKTKKMATPTCETFKKERQASLSDIEKQILTNLFIDCPEESCKPIMKKIQRNENRRRSRINSEPSRSLTKEMLFSSLPSSTVATQRRLSQRDTTHHVNLWREHENKISAYERRMSSSMEKKDGNKSDTASIPRSLVTPTIDINNSEKRPSLKETIFNRQEEDVEKMKIKKPESITMVDTTSKKRTSDAWSEAEVRCVHDPDNDDSSSASSWKPEDGGFEHYDTWNVLKDEYAEDFGFKYPNADSSNPHIIIEDSDDDDDESENQLFRIIGTSADDHDAHPHVLSPPLMEALLNFVPDSLTSENFWLKYSLIRDGADLETLLHYVRAAHHTILAIETTTGDVFGCFTSSPWKMRRNYYGNGDAFVWRMRHNRLTPCASLYEQAKMESEIDVFPFTRINESIQMCNHGMIGVGSGEIDENLCDRPFTDAIKSELSSMKSNGEILGFAIALNGDLTEGTTSRSATFFNPILTSGNKNGGVFEISNLEIWSFTPCNTVEEAQKLEMRNFFIEESMSDRFSNVSTRSSFTMQSEDLNQRQFYRRVGDEDENEIDRTGWQYANMMNNYTKYSSIPSILNS